MRRRNKLSLILSFLLSLAMVLQGPVMAQVAVAISIQVIMSNCG